MRVLALTLMLAVVTVGLVPTATSQPPARGDDARLWMHFDRPSPTSEDQSRNGAFMNVQEPGDLRFSTVFNFGDRPAWSVFVSPDVLPLSAQGANYDHFHWQSIQYGFGPTGPASLHWIFNVGEQPPGGVAQLPGETPLVGQLLVRLDIVYPGGFDDAILEEVARGRSPTVTLVGPGSQGIEVVDVDGRQAYAVDVALEFVPTILPVAKNHYLRLAVDFVVPDTDEQVPGLAGWAASSPQQPSYLDVRVEDPLALEEPEVDLDTDFVHVRARLLSPWGPADIVPADGASIVLLDGIPATHHAFDPPVHEDFHARFNGYQSWGWDLRAAPLEPGDHVLRIAFTTWDGSANLTSEFVVPVVAGRTMHCGLQEAHWWWDAPVEREAYCTSKQGKPEAAMPLQGSLAILALAGALVARRRA